MRSPKMFSILLIIALSVDVSAQTPSTQPSTSSAETYPALRKLADRLQKEVYELKDQNEQLQREVEALKTRLNQLLPPEDEIPADLPPAILSAYARREVVVGMPFTLVKRLWEPSKPVQTYSSETSATYELQEDVVAADQLAQTNVVVGRRTIMNIGVDKKTNLVTTIRGNPFGSPARQPPPATEPEPKKSKPKK